MYNVLIVEDDPMARKLLEIFVATSDQYHLVPSLDSAAMAELYCMTNQVDPERKSAEKEGTSLL